MKIKFTGRFIEDILPVFKQEGFIVDNEKPDLIIAHGGDGTLLSADREYPDVPKLPIRDKRTSPLCPKHSYNDIVNLLRMNKLSDFKLMRLIGKSGDKKVIGINDVFIHNADRVGAIRYMVFIDSELYAAKVVGDAVGVATVHGSTAYYRSITHSIFRIGIGLAFSNSTEVTNHLVLPEDSVIKIKITRGPAIMVADNGSEQINLGAGSEAVIHKTGDFALIKGLDIFMCPECRRLRYENCS